MGQGNLPRPLRTGKHCVSKRKAGCDGGYFKPHAYLLPIAHAWCTGEINLASVRKGYYRSIL